MVIKNWQIYSKLNNGTEIGLLPALNELSLLKGNAKVAYATAKNIKILTSALEIKNKVHESIVKAHAIQDAEGKFPTDEKGEFLFETEEVKDSVIKELTDLDALDSEVSIHLIYQADIETVQEITGNLILRLGEIISE